MYGCGCVVVVRLQESFFPTANAESFTKQLTDVWASSPIFESSKVRNRVGGEAVVLALRTESDGRMQGVREASIEASRPGSKQVVRASGTTVEAQGTPGVEDERIRTSASIVD